MHGSSLRASPSVLLTAQGVRSMMFFVLGLVALKTFRHMGQGLRPPAPLCPNMAFNADSSAIRFA